MRVYFLQAGIQKKKEKKLSSKQYSICMLFYRQEHSRIKKEAKKAKQYFMFCANKQDVVFCLAFNYQLSRTVLLAFSESIFTSRQTDLYCHLNYTVYHCVWSFTGRQTEKRDQPSHKIHVSFCVHFYRQTIKTIATKLKSIYFCVDRQKDKQIYKAMQYFILSVLLLSILFAEVPFWCQTQTHSRLLPGLPSPAP